MIYSPSLCSFLRSPLTVFLLGPNILLSTLSSKTLSLHYSLNISDQVSQPHTTVRTKCSLKMPWIIAGTHTQMEPFRICKVITCRLLTKY
jgi:hypothetical protein